MGPCLLPITLNSSANRASIPNLLSTFLLQTYLKIYINKPIFVIKHEQYFTSFMEMSILNIPIKHNKHSLLSNLKFGVLCAPPASSCRRLVTEGHLMGTLYAPWLVCPMIQQYNNDNKRK